MLGVIFKLRGPWTCAGDYPSGQGRYGHCVGDEERQRAPARWEPLRVSKEVNRAVESYCLTAQDLHERQETCANAKSAAAGMTNPRIVGRSRRRSEIMAAERIGTPTAIGSVYRPRQYAQASRADMPSKTAVTTTTAAMSPITTARRTALKRTATTTRATRASAHTIMTKVGAKAKSSRSPSNAPTIWRAYNPVRPTDCERVCEAQVRRPVRIGQLRVERSGALRPRDAAQSDQPEPDEPGPKPSVSCKSLD